MAVKAGELIKTILMKSNMSSSDYLDLAKKLDESGIEFPDEVGDAIKELNTLDYFEKNVKSQLDETEKKKMVNQFRAEAYSRFDKLIEQYIELLPAEQKAEIEGLGEKKSIEKIDKMMNFFRERNTADSNLASDAKTFKKKLDEINKAIEAGEYVPKSKFEEVSSGLTQAQQRIYQKELLTAALFDDNVAGSVKKERWFKQQYLNDAEELMSKKGVYFDVNTGKFKQKGKEEYALKEGTSEPYSLNDFTADMVGEFPDYQKRSDGPAPDGNVNVPAGQTSGEISAYQRRVAERAAEYAD